MVVLAIVFAAAASAAPRDPDLPNLAAALRGVAVGEADRRSDFAAARPGLADDEGAVVVVETAETAAAAAALSAMGGEVEVVTTGLVQVWLPYDALPAAGALPGVVRVREPWLASAKVSVPKTTVTEGLDQLFDGGDWHAAGWTGRGVHVAVLDIGFAGYADLLGVELPDDVETDFVSDVQSTGHGTAVAEVIHDIAPEADLELVQFRSDAEYLAALDRLVEDGIDVVNASIGWDDVWHADGTSPYTTAADVVALEGTVWVGAAGNENEKYRIGPLTDVDGDGVVEIDGVEGTWVWAPGGALSVRLRWSDAMGLASTDLDLVAWDDQGDPCGRSDDPQDGVGSHPLESITTTCESDWVFVAPTVPDGGDQALSSALEEGGHDQLVGFLYGASGLDAGAATGAQNLTLPGDGRFGISVGACDKAAGTAADYSSRGPTDDGRTKPDLCATAGVTTETFGEGRFSGSSAAAPHVAGLAALVLDARLADDPAGVRAWLSEHAADLGEVGVDNVFGAGAATAGPPPERRCGCAAGASPRPSAMPWIAPLLAALTWARQRACPGYRDRIPRGTRRFAASGCAA